MAIIIMESTQNTNSKSTQKRKYFPKKKPQNKQYRAKKPEGRLNPNAKEFQKSWNETGSQQYNSIKNQLEKRELECTICLNKIGWRGRIWCCEQCRVPQHLSCVNKWKDTCGLSWFCPACNSPYNNTPKYTCFCGKVEEPQQQPMLPPHSCGEVCSRKRADHCEHLCPQLCHPGACPPCTSTVQKSCCCGKKSIQVLCRDSVNPITCNLICGKLKNCGKHRCEKQCHSGECSSCSVENLSLCHCGRIQQSRRCSEEVFSCGNECNRTLKCGEHVCEDLCHPGDCKECEYLPEKVETCPCGKMDLNLLLIYAREKCTDPIPLCHMPCDKILRCGHRCKSSCHHGACPPCPSSITVDCRCTSSTFDIQCSQLGSQILCNKPCKTKKSCNKHKCEEVCCVAKGKKNLPKHLCTESCGKILNCELHNCLHYCHIGNCEPCKVVYRHRIYCSCGHTYKEPPIRCGTPDMEVNCNQKCRKELPCGHKCQSSCHSGECPPCVKLVDKPCFCGGMYRPVPCNTFKVSCGRGCTTVKFCGHKCNKQCHSEPCNSEPCKLPCGKQKPCGHTCVLGCHYPEACPDTPCKVEMKVWCNCGMQYEFMNCFEKKEKPCDEECERLERNKKLEEAFGSKEEEVYSEELVEYAQNNFQFVKKVESKLQSIIQEGKNMNFLPSMKPEQRWFCHEVIPYHYGLDCESVDQEPVRSIVVYMTENAKTPSPLLSEYVKRGCVGEAAKKEPAASLFFYQLTPSITTQDMAAALQKFQGEYQIKWNNDHSAYAHFNSIHKCEEAKKVVTRIPGPFSVVKMILYDKVNEGEGFKKKFRNSKKPKEVTSFEEETNSN